jgi:hypothetical protein
MIRSERCLEGRLRSAYPVAAHDIEMRVDDVELADLAGVLREESGRLLGADPRCRKVVFAALAGDAAVIAAAEAAAFRYVVDVDIVQDGDIEELSLMVREQPYVTAVDMDLEHVPDR